MSGNEQVRVEMQTFLQAIASYAERVADDPRITFEEHHVSLMVPSRSAPRKTSSTRTLHRH